MSMEQGPEFFASEMEEEKSTGDEEKKNSFITAQGYKSITRDLPGMLPPQEQKQAFAQLAEGDKQAREKLINHNLRFLVLIIKQLNPHINDWEDFFSVGEIGLIKAVDTFNPSKGNKFTTYASTCIRNEIFMSLRKDKKRRQDVSLETPVADADSTFTLEQTLPATDNTEQSAINNLEVAKLRELVANLDERDRAIIQAIFFDDLPEHEVSKKLNISQSYVSRLKKKILLQLKKQLEKT